MNGIYKMKKYIAVAILAALAGIYFLYHYIQKKPSFNINYSITNLAGLQDCSNGLGYDYQQTFVVEGKIKLKNYKVNKVTLTADAVGDNGATIRIFTIIDMHLGNNTYSYRMDSFYKNGVKKVISVKNFTVKEV